MRRHRFAGLFAIMLAVLALLLHPVAMAGDGESAGSANPIFNSFNEPMNFAQLQPGHIEAAVQDVIADTRSGLELIYNVPDEKRTFENTMRVLDNLYNRLETVMGTVSLIANAHPDSVIRNTALAQSTELDKYVNELNLDEQLYQAVKAYAASDEAGHLQASYKKFLQETVDGFERNGFSLPPEKREELKKIQDRLAELGVQFSKNIAEYKDFLILEEADMAGLPEDYKKSHRQEDGTYKIDLSYPSYIPFMRNAESDQARKALYTKFNNRAADKNLEVLRKFLIERQNMAKLLGYSSYAAYRVGDRMAKKAETVWTFENDLIDKVKVKARRDYDELLEVKRAHSNDPTADVIQPWEAGYYRNLLLKEKYQLDDEKVKEYFELNNVIDGLFKITQHLFGLEYREVENPSVWHSDVRMFEVMRDGQLIGRFYLDLHPRPNKYTHAACFPMITGKMTDDGFQLPSATLECNFPRPTEGKPALLPHSQAETFFHEFGHVLHHLVSRTELSSQSGFSVSRDFVEAPSQIFENWVWDYDALKLFARHYKTGEVLPRDLYERMIASKNVGSGLGTLQQIFYGLVDFTLHDSYDPRGPVSTTEIVRKLQNEITLYPHLEGTHFEAAFGHLYGYGASYYGYLWSKVYAEDMFSVFQKNGVMDQASGFRYRDIILAKGASEDELELVKEFLQREPNQEAFLRSIGL